MLRSNMYSGEGTHQTVGRFKEALLSYNKVIAFDPKYVEAYNNFGNLLRDCGRPGLSLEFYKTAIN